MDVWLIFLTGLTIGGLTCMAVRGGLLASTIAAREEEEVREGKNTKNPVWPTLAFSVTKLIAYIALGFLLGAFGAAIQLTEGLRVGMQLFAGIYMVLVAFNLLNVHPIFASAAMALSSISVVSNSLLLKRFKI